MKIVLNNFQILEGENTLEFKEGINVVVGPNASGKSSMFYAIENALTNPNGVDDCINYNHKQTSVRIQNNDEDITWKRNIGSSVYVNNKTGEEYVKASKLDSRDLADLGFYFDQKNRVVNIHNEWSVLFPFGESDTDMFRLFEDIFNISCSFQIIDEMKKDEQGLRSTVSKYQTENASLVKRLEMLQEIKEKVDIQVVNDYIESLQSYELLASELRKDYEIFSKNYLLTNVVLPKVYDVSKLYESQHAIETIHTDYQNYLKFKEKATVKLPSLNLNISIPKFNDEMKQDYEQYCVTKATLTQYNEQLKKIKNEISNINNKISQIKVCPTCGHILEE